MIVLNDKPTVYIDIDQTLIYWHYDSNKPTIEINGTKFNYHKAHIEQLKQHKARNHNVIIWSAGGSECWAKNVIKSLQLEKYVDIVIPKPTWFVDDLPASEFMPENRRIYIEEK